jgi:hypothetical protein
MKNNYSQVLMAISKTVELHKLEILYLILGKVSLINTTGATSGAGTAYTSTAPEFTPGF